MAQLGHRDQIMTRRVRIRTDRVFLRRNRARTVPPMSSLLIRRAHTNDSRELTRLAALDSSNPLQGDILLARADGELRAALSLSDGRVVADPFARTAQIVRTLRTWTS
jgi:hypothetical protein